MDDMEVKADALDGAFDAVLAAEAVDELKGSVAALKAQVERQAVAASRLPLDGAKAADPARDAFVERYLRRGIDAGVEMKSLSGASGGEGALVLARRDLGSSAQLELPAWRQLGVGLAYERFCPASECTSSGRSSDGDLRSFSRELTRSARALCRRWGAS